LVVADKTEFVETADIVVVGIAGVVAAEIDMVVVDTSCDHYYSLVVDCIDMDAFYHSEIVHFDDDIGFDIADIDFVVPDVAVPFARRLEPWAYRHLFRLAYAILVSWISLAFVIVALVQVE